MGDPSSPHYSDLALSWARGEYVPLLYTAGHVSRRQRWRVFGLSNSVVTRVLPIVSTIVASPLSVSSFRNTMHSLPRSARRNSRPAASWTAISRRSDNTSILSRRFSLRTPSTPKQRPGPVIDHALDDHGVG